MKCLIVLLLFAHVGMAQQVILKNGCPDGSVTLDTDIYELDHPNNVIAYHGLESNKQQKINLSDETWYVLSFTVRNICGDDVATCEDGKTYEVSELQVISKSLRHYWQDEKLYYKAGRNHVITIVNTTCFKFHKP